MSIGRCASARTHTLRHKHLCVSSRPMVFSLCHCMASTRSGVTDTLAINRQKRKGTLTRSHRAAFPFSCCPGQTFGLHTVAAERWAWTRKRKKATPQLWLLARGTRNDLRFVTSPLLCLTTYGPRLTKRKKNHAWAIKVVSKKR